MLASYLGSEIIPIATMCSLIFILLVLIESALGGDSNSTHVSDVNFVVPMSVNCEHNQTCLNMHLYVEDKDKFFKDGAVFIFLAGNHSLQKQLNLTGISRITLRSQENSSSVNIICSNTVTFRCENVTDFNVTGLTFLLQSNEHQIASALAFFSSAKIMISNSIFQGRCTAGNTSAWAVFSYNSSITIVNSLFEGNTGSKGGALSVQRGSTLVSIHNNFTRNRGSISSGALHVSRSTTLLEDSVFSHNSGEVGGAIYCLFCSLTITGQTKFINNSCKMMGGAIRMRNGNLSVAGNACFYNNEAENGGAIHLFNSNAAIISQAITFDSNIARKNGGGIFMKSQSNKESAHAIISAKFCSNRAEVGGAMYIVQEKSVTLNNINIVNNSGDALHIHSSTLINFKGTNTFTGNYNRPLVISCDIYYNHICGVEVVFDGNNTFSENQEAFSLDWSRVLFRGNTTISGNENTAAAISSSTVKFEGRTLIYNNSASYSVLFLRNSDISFYGTTNYISNVGTNNIDTLAGTLSFNDVSNFINNRATEGGVIISAYGRLSFANTTLFMNNSASTGGAINSIRGNTILEGNCTFVNNSAKTGGASYIQFI